MKIWCIKQKLTELEQRRSRVCGFKKKEPWGAWFEKIHLCEQSCCKDEVKSVIVDKCDWIKLGWSTSSHTADATMPPSGQKTDCSLTQLWWSFVFYFFMDVWRVLCSLDAIGVQTHQEKRLKHSNVPYSHTQISLCAMWPVSVQTTFHIHRHINFSVVRLKCSEPLKHFIHTWTVVSALSPLYRALLFSNTPPVESSSWGEYVFFLNWMQWRFSHLTINTRKYLMFWLHFVPNPACVLEYVTVWVTSVTYSIRGAKNMK